MPRTAGSATFGYVKVSPRTLITSAVMSDDAAVVATVSIVGPLLDSGYASSDQTSRSAVTDYTEFSEILKTQNRRSR